MLYYHGCMLASCCLGIGGQSQNPFYITLLFIVSVLLVSVLVFLPNALVSLVYARNKTCLNVPFIFFFTEGQSSKQECQYPSPLGEARGVSFIPLLAQMIGT